jgi:hypothetical protein
MSESIVQHSNAAYRSVRHSGVALIAASALVLLGCGVEDTEDLGELEENEVEDIPPPPPVDPGDQAADDDITPDDDPALDEEMGVDEQPPAIVAVGPPANELGAPIALDPVVFASDEVFVAISGVALYSTGAVIELSLRYPPDGADRETGDPEPRPGPPMDLPIEDPPTGEDDLPDDLLRLEIVYPDGRVASTVEHQLARADPDRSPEEPLLDAFQGFGDSESWDQQLWLQPAPEPGDEPLEVAVTWPEHDLEDERADLDAEQLADASERIVELWPPEDAQAAGAQDR